jgi:protoheme IX farnesyltransferase
VQAEVIDKRVEGSKMKDYAVFIKMRLATLVVLSAVFSFVIASNGPVDWFKLSMLVLGGFLVTGSSNGFNQVIERDLDKLMDRTKKRPLPMERMGVNEAIYLAAVMGGAGIFVLTYFMNPMSGILGAVALLLYTIVYTPLKRKTPLAVFIGAFPGAIPAMLGYVAAGDGFGEITFPAWVLFGVQFMWQFPHFWAIAWVMDDDYKKAGFKMLPSLGGRDRSSAFQALMYSLFLIPMSLAPFFFHISDNIVAAVVITLCGFGFAYQAYVLFRDLTVKAAQKLMFGSFFYLPLVQIATMLG